VTGPARHLTPGAPASCIGRRARFYHGKQSRHRPSVSFLFRIGVSPLLSSENLMTKALLILSEEAFHIVYPTRVLEKLRARVDSLDIITPAESWPEHRDALAQAEVIFSGWGAPVMDEAFLAAAPALKAVFYAAGTVRDFVTDAFWERDILLTTARDINAIPVSEFAAAAITLGLKRAWHYARLTREARTFPADRPMPGAYGSTVGLVSYGVIARMTRERLRSLDVRVQVFDPYLSEEEARQEEVDRVDLEELFATSDAVSVHTPKLEETLGLIRGHHLARLRPGALFLNTARGAVINEPEMIDVLRRRTDIQAVLDVTHPEPPAADSPLYELPNVFLTPHIAGSMGPECERMGLAMIDELIRYQNGEPLRWAIDAHIAARIA